MENHSIKPNYYAIIPANIRYDNDLTANSKLLYGEITALANKEGYCWANNKYFADLYGVQKRSIILWIDQLIQKGYIRKEIVYQDKSATVEQRKLFIQDAVQIKEYQQNLEGGVNNDTGVKNYTGVKNDTDNNTSNKNNKLNKPNSIFNKNNKIKKVKTITLKDKISLYTKNSEIRKALHDYLEMYKEKFKGYPTHVSFDKMLEDLRKFCGDKATDALQIIDRSTKCGYREFYALNDNGNGGTTLKGACYVRGETKKANAEDIVDVEY